MRGGIRSAIWLLSVALLAAAVASPASLAAKKGKRKVFETTQSVGAPIPNQASPTSPFGLLTVTAEVPKKFKGLRIRDVDVTVQTTGLTGTSPSGDLFAKLTAPNGATTRLFSTLTGPPSISIGPLTLDDEAPLFMGDGPPINPTLLYTPWAGSSRPDGAPLHVMDDGPARGTWTLKVVDATTADTSALTSWGLRVTAGRPYATE
jgi:subtilisin-like proprotein convertase family protein